MYLEKTHLFSGITYETPKIYWEEEDKYAIIAFLLLSIDKNAGKDGKVRLDDLFGLNETVPEPEGEEGSEDNGKNEKQAARDAIVRECEKFLNALHDDERYDTIQDEIDKFIEGEDAYNLKCAIGDSYGTFGATRNKLEGAAYHLWDLVKLVVFDTDYQGNKKRLLKHLARKWDIGRSLLPALEEAAQALTSITQERRDLVESDKSFREVNVRLIELTAREKETWEKLNKLGVYEDRTVSSIGESWRGMANAASSMAGLLNPDFKVNLEEEGLEDDEDEEEDEPGLGDKITDGICSGIEKVTDVLCAPLEWMTDKLMGL
jgi:hypothetical protein